MQILASSPLLTLFLVIALGTLFGSIPFGPLKFGAAGALFVGLAAGALDPALGENLSLVSAIGLALFVYTIGLAAGASFFRDLRKQAPLLIGAVALLALYALIVAFGGKALGLNSPLLGGMFAGVEESPGDTIIFNGRKYKAYRGMGSLEAMEKGSKDRYFQNSVSDAKKLVPEGIAARVPYKGTLYEVAYQMLGGLRAGMGYCGAATIEALHQAKFVKITNAGVAESHPHDVTITSEAPNYSRS